MSKVRIGKRELFSFAERYSGKRPKEYADLADGTALCSLFNLIFPAHRIRLAPSQTHSLSQRSHMNWEALVRGCARLRVPVALLDRPALLANDAERGFATLVLFYFLFHLSKRTDFTAEFAADVADDVTNYLQSVDSITSLILGGALKWSMVPTSLAEQIRQLPAFHSTPVEVTALEADAVRAYREKCGFGAVTSYSRTSSSGRPSESHLMPLNHVTLMDYKSPSPSDGSRCAAGLENGTKETRNVSRSCDLERWQAEADGVLSASQCTGCGPSSIAYSERASATGRSLDTSVAGDRHKEPAGGLPTAGMGRSASLPEETSERLRAALARELELQSLLVQKSEECEALNVRTVELVSQLAQTKAAACGARSSESPEPFRELYEREHRRCCVLERQLQQLSSQRKGSTDSDIAVQTQWRKDMEAAVGALLEDVRDADTGEVVDAHEMVNMLHCLLLEKLRDAPVHREQAQLWLWRFLEAYHEMERRVVSAVDLLDSFLLPEMQRIAPFSAPSSEGKECVDLVDGPIVEEKTLSDIQRRHEDGLRHAHTVEHQLRQEVTSLKLSLQHVATLAGEREQTWKQLCAAVHRAEQLSFSVARHESDEMVEAIVAQRTQCYDLAEQLTERLMDSAATPVKALVKGEKALDEIPACASVLEHLQSVCEHRQHLQLLVEKLQKRLCEFGASPNTGQVPSARLCGPAETPVLDHSRADGSATLVYSNELNGTTESHLRGEAAQAGSPRSPTRRCGPAATCDAILSTLLNQAPNPFVALSLDA